MKRTVTILTLLLTVISATFMQSCSKDDDDTEITNDVSCFLSDDILELYDVQIVRTATNASGKTVKVYEFNSTSGYVKDSIVTRGKQCKDSFLSYAGSRITIEPTLTLKANWREILAGKDELILVAWRSVNDKESSKAKYLKGETMKTEATEDWLLTYASQYASTLMYPKKNE